MSSTWQVRRSVVVALLATTFAVPANADVAIGVLRSFVAEGQFLQKMLIGQAAQAFRIR